MIGVVVIVFLIAVTSAAPRFGSPDGVSTTMGPPVNCSFYELCDLPNYNDLKRDSPGAIGMWVLIAMFALFVITICCFTWHTCSNLMFNLHGHDEVSEGSMDGDPESDDDVTWMNRSKLISSKRSTDAKPPDIETQPDAIVTIETKYTEGPQVYYDKQEKVVAKSNVINRDGVINVAKVHEQFGNPISAGFNRDQNASNPDTLIALPRELGNRETTLPRSPEVALVLKAENTGP